MNELRHFGVLGMKWGVRRSKKPNSSDHEVMSKIRNKRLKDMSDAEIRTAVKRLKLIKEYRKSFRKPEDIRKLSNAEIEDRINRGKLAREYIKTYHLSGLTKMKDISKMSDVQVRKALERVSLDKQYKELASEDYKKLASFIAIFLAMNK